MEEKIAVQCKTEKEWNMVKGKKLTVTGWFKGGGNRCISVGKQIDGDCGQGYEDWYIKNDYTIISAADYLKEGEVEEFKVGDEVEFIKGGLCGCEDKEWWRREELLLGKTYTIYQLSDKGNPKVIQGGFWHNKGHFELANKSTKSKTTKENNMNINSSIRKVFIEEDKAVFDLVEKMQKVFGGEIAENFTGAMILRDNKKQYTDEIKRLDDIEAKRLKEEAKK